MRHVYPAAMIGDKYSYYDREKYGGLVLDVSDTILKPFEAGRTPPLNLDAL